jgi:hypothetical protein
VDDVSVEVAYSLAAVGMRAVDMEGKERVASACHYHARKYLYLYDKRACDPSMTKFSLR